MAQEGCTDIVLIDALTVICDTNHGYAAVSDLYCHR